MQKPIELKNINKSKNYILKHKANKNFIYEVASVSVKDKPAHQLYEFISNSSKKFIGIVDLNERSKVDGIEISEFDIYENIL